MRPSLVPFLFYLFVLCAGAPSHRSPDVANSPPSRSPEIAAGDPPLSSPDVVRAYQRVFRVRGGAEIMGRTPPVSYALDRLRVLLGEAALPVSASPLDLSAVRALEHDALLRLLFLAVAGDYVTGPAALRPMICRIEADPITGTLDVVSGRADAEAALTVIAVVLLLAVVMGVYRREPASK